MGDIQNPTFAVKSHHQVLLAPSLVVETGERSCRTSSPTVSSQFVANKRPIEPPTNQDSKRPRLIPNPGVVANPVANAGLSILQMPEHRLKEVIMQLHRQVNQLKSEGQAAVAQEKQEQLSKLVQLYQHKAAQSSGELI
jgi:hypothetical protein